MHPNLLLGPHDGGRPEPGAHGIGPPAARTRRRQTAWGLLASTGWLVACVLGSYVGMGYDFRPGALGSGRAGWPDDTALKPCPGRVTVLAFLHPRCVCTAATVKQLVRAMRQHPEAQLIAVMFTPPESEPAEGWQDTEYEQTIRAEVAGARVVADPGGREAARFGAHTSGTILVYDPRGREVFRGGITDRRGGEEDNAGLRQFTRALAGQWPDQPHPTPVFGCSLQAPDGPPTGGQGDVP